VINKILTDKMQRKPQKKIQVYHIITSASGYYELKKNITATSSYKNFIQLRDTYFMNTCKKRRRRRKEVKTDTKTFYAKDPIHYEYKT